MQLTSDPRRADRERRFKPPPPTSAPAEDLTTDYMNILGMVFSMCGLMMRLKWSAWTAVFCSSISFANARVSDDTKQVFELLKYCDWFNKRNIEKIERKDGRLQWGSYHSK